jgi:hypothetical protein
LTSNLIITRFTAQSLIPAGNRPHPHHSLKLKVTSYISIQFIYQVLFSYWLANIFLYL